MSHCSADGGAVLGFSPIVLLALALVFLRETRSNNTLHIISSSFKSLNRISINDIRCVGCTQDCPLL